MSKCRYLYYIHWGSCTRQSPVISCTDQVYFQNEGTRGKLRQALQNFEKKDMVSRCRSQRNLPSRLVIIFEIALDRIGQAPTKKKRKKTLHCGPLKFSEIRTDYLSTTRGSIPEPWFLNSVNGSVLVKYTA